MDCRRKRTKSLFAVQLWKLRNLIQLIKAKVGHCLKLSIRETFQQSAIMSSESVVSIEREEMESLLSDYFSIISPADWHCALWCGPIDNSSQGSFLAGTAGCYRLLNYKSWWDVKISLLADGSPAPQSEHQDPHVSYN